MLFKDSIKIFHEELQQRNSLYFVSANRKQKLKSFCEIDEFLYSLRNDIFWCRGVVVITPAQIHST